MSTTEQMDINPGDWVEVCDLDGPKMLSNRSAFVNMIWQAAATAPSTEDLTGMLLSAGDTATLESANLGDKLFVRVQGLSGALLVYWEYTAPDGDEDLVMAQVKQAIDTWRDAAVALDLVYPAIDLGAYKATVVWVNAVSFGGVGVGINQDDVLGMSGIGFYTNGSDAVPNSRVRLAVQGTNLVLSQNSGYNLNRGAAVVIYHR